MESLNTERIFNAIERVQGSLEKEEGVFLLEVVQNIERNPTATIGEVEIQIDPILLELITTNRVYFSKDIARVSVKPLPGYISWKDIQETQFKGFALTKDFIITWNTAPALNFDNLREILFSRDSERHEER